VSNTPAGLVLQSASAAVDASADACEEGDLNHKKTQAFVLLPPDAQLRAYSTLLAENQYYRRRIRELTEHPQRGATEYI